MNEDEDRIARQAADRATREANLENEVRNLKGELSNLKKWRDEFEERVRKLVLRGLVAVWGGVLYVGSIVVEKLTAGWWPK